jgi:hypothetical protein
VNKVTKKQTKKQTNKTRTVPGPWTGSIWAERSADQSGYQPSIVQTNHGTDQSVYGPIMYIVQTNQCTGT